MRTRTLSLAVMAFIMVVLIMTSGMVRVAHAQVHNGRAKIAEEAFIYGFPMVMNYVMFYQYFIDKSDPSYKAPLNQIWNAPNVFTYKDTAIVTPNSDTPYSFIGMDLRAEPYVICNPLLAFATTSARGGRGCAGVGLVRRTRVSARGFPGSNHYWLGTSATR
jgi:hypothetical protein